MKIEKIYDGNIEYGIIKSNGVLLGNYAMPNWDDINSVGFIDIAYKDYLVSIIIPCALDKSPFIPYGKITKIDRRKNNLLSYIINKVVSELNIIMPMVIKQKQWYVEGT